MSCYCEPESPYHKTLSAASGVLLGVGLFLSITIDHHEALPLYTSFPSVADWILILSAALIAEFAEAAAIGFGSSSR